VLLSRRGPSCWGGLSRAHFDVVAEKLLMWSVFMLNRNMLLVTTVTMLVSVACGNASFFGGGSSKRKETVTQNQNTNGQNPNGQSPNGQNPNGQNPFGQNTNGQNPVNGQNPQTGPADQISQPNPNTIVFGQDKVFHIGDGRFQNTSCKDEISQLPLTGTAYFFQFEVLNDNTTLNINVAKICGVDYQTNTFEIYGLTSRLQGQYIPLNSPTASASNVTLKKGAYSILLTSGWGKDTDSSAADRDDYIVGKVTVEGNNAIRPIRYGAYNR
jgi:hypothetical protein